MKAKKSAKKTQKENETPMEVDENEEAVDSTQDLAQVSVASSRKFNPEGNTTNLAFHLDHEHTIGACASVSKYAASVSQQPRINQFVSPSSQSQVSSRLSKTKKAEIDDVLNKLIVRKVLPMSLVDCEEFKHLIHLLDQRYESPSRKTLQKDLEKKKTAMEKALRADLAECSSIAITHDGWTSCNTESYSTVTGHFISNAWKLRVVSLQTKKMEGSHSSENIAKHLQELKNSWNLPTIIAVTDNAANEKKAFELLGWVRFGCFGHRLNLIVRHSLEDPVTARLIGKARKLVTFFHQSSSVSDLLLTKQQLLMSEKEPLKLICDVATRWNSTHSMLKRIVLLTPAIIAVAHDTSISKTAATTIRNCTFSCDEQVLAERLVDLLDPFLKATESVASEKVPTLHKILPIILKLDKVTAVNEDDPLPLIAVKEKMRTEIQKRTQDSELALLGCVLNPFTKDLRFLDDEKRQKAVDLLHVNMMALDVTNTSGPAKVKQEQAEQHESRIHSETNEPELPQAPEAIQFETPLPDTPVSSGNATQPLEKGATQSDSPVIEILENELPSKKAKTDSSSHVGDLDNWLSDVVCVGESKISNAELVQQEMTRYLSAVLSVDDKQLTILEWWHQNERYFPRLGVIAKKYLAVPASSIPSERIFSLCGLLVSKKRSRLSPQSVSTMVFLNKNMNLYW